MSDVAAPERPSPLRSRPGVRRLVRLLVIVDVLLLVAVLALWLVLRSGADERANVLNEGLRGSLPPAGQQLPPLGDIAEIQPAFPAAAQLQGSSSMLVGTCIDCRSGDMIGGFLGRLGEDTLPEDSPVHVVTWEGDPAAWREKWHLPDDVTVHHAQTPAAVERVRELLGVAPVAGAEESGITYLYDASGTWRSTYFIGQLHPDDIAHDLRVLAREP